jgi:hypothetical protein
LKNGSHWQNRAGIQAIIQQLAAQFPVTSKWEYLRGYLGIDGARSNVKKGSHTIDCSHGVSGAPSLSPGVKHEAFI